MDLSAAGCERQEASVTRVFINGCFDMLHEGHMRLLRAARNIGHKSMECKWTMGPTNGIKLIVAINSDNFARRLKADKWGPGYPIDDQFTRAAKLRSYADEVRIFDNEGQLYALISAFAPCILVKGPDYAGQRVTGDDLAPVLILDTPEPEAVKAMKREKYGLVSAVDRSSHVVTDSDK